MNDLLFSLLDKISDKSNLSRIYFGFQFGVERPLWQRRCEGRAVRQPGTVTHNEDVEIDTTARLAFSFLPSLGPQPIDVRYFSHLG